MGKNPGGGNLVGPTLLLIARFLVQSFALGARMAALTSTFTKQVASLARIAFSKLRVIGSTKFSILTPHPPFLRGKKRQERDLSRCISLEEKVSKVKCIQYAPEENDEHKSC